MNDIQNDFNVIFHLSNLVDQQREENEVSNRDLEKLVNWIIFMKKSPKIFTRMDVIQSKNVNISFKSWNFVWDEVIGMNEKGQKIVGDFG